METSTLLSQNVILDRPQLALVPTPAGTATHRPIPHHEVVNALVETLGGKPRPGERFAGRGRDRHAVTAPATFRLFLHQTNWVRGGELTGARRRVPRIP
jgi:hypothetical protein